MGCFYGCHYRIQRRRIRTRGAFIELFGIEDEIDGEKVDMTTQEAQITNSTSVMMTTVAGDDYAIGYVSLACLTIA